MEKHDDYGNKDLIKLFTVLDVTISNADAVECRDTHGTESYRSCRLQ